MGRAGGRKEARPELLKLLQDGSVEGDAGVAAALIQANFRGMQVRQVKGRTRASIGRKVMRDNLLEFQKADVDNDGELDFDEFSQMMFNLTGTEWTYSQLQSWFEAMDTDGDGHISQDEFFYYSLRDAQQHSSMNLNDTFASLDSDGSGFINYQEFQRGCRSFGFGEISHELFEQLDVNNSGSIAYQELVIEMQRRTVSAPAKSFLLAVLHRPRPETLEADDSSDDDEETTQERESPSPLLRRESASAESPRRLRKRTGGIYAHGAPGGLPSYAQGGSPASASPSQAFPSTGQPVYHLTSEAARRSNSPTKPREQGAGSRELRALEQPSTEAAPKRRPKSRPTNPDAACPFASVIITGFGFAHNGLAQKSLNKPAVKSRYLGAEGTMKSKANESSAASLARELEKKMVVHEAEGAVGGTSSVFAQTDRDGSGDLDFVEFSTLVQQQLRFTRAGKANELKVRMHTAGRTAGHTAGHTAPCAHGEYRHARR